MKKKLFIFLSILLLIPSIVMANGDLETKAGVALHKNARRVPILMYHEVGYTPKAEFIGANYVHREALETQLFYLAANGIKTITMSQLYDNWVNGTELPDKCIVMTFDDGYASHFTLVNQILSRFNAKATFYIIKDRLYYGIENRDVEGLKKLAKSGQEIGSHTMTHPNFHEATYDEIYSEIAESKAFLEETLGIEVKTFSYPYGNHNANARKILNELGMQTAVTTKEGLSNPKQFENDNLLLMSRHNIGYETPMDEFIRIVNGQ